ncbi:Wzz/FepE/Etk N-terminal domain-containing protein [Rheinheimera sp. NSM]|uniref:Wzz/FepE/Etk N-terminal domain-containing protein n=1 Tax=Rheinheimera sp. NSM TaxID=3457884 RepID=UPI00403679C9
MSQQHVTQRPQAADDEIDLRELFAVIWHGKWIIIATTFVFAVASVFYALSLPNIYKSEVLLAPVSESSALKMPGQLGGLAALAGVNLGDGGDDKTVLALEILKSRTFIGRFIEKYDLLVPVMASKGWQRSGDVLQIDEELYDAVNKKWVRKVKAPFQPQPSLLEVHETFLKMLDITEDVKTGMVKLSIEHYSPYLAQQWVELLVKEINNEMRSRDLSEAQNSITYLNQQIQSTNVADMRSTLYSLIEEQTQTVMLANVRDEYVFKTVDPAIVPELKSKPRRAMIVILSAFLGGVFSILFVIVRNFSKKSSEAGF